jgi:hypothetical protein
MSKFLVLYNSSIPTSEMMANITPEQGQAGMETWMAWASKWGGAIVDMGSPVGKGRRVSKGEVSTAPVPVSGYSIVEAESADAAVEIFRDHPHFLTPSETSIDVLECLPVPGT